MSSLAVVILNYNRADLLADCLKSIYSAPTRCALTVWVVDNASTDGSAEMVQTRFPQAQLIVSPVNGGFAYGNNLALRAILAGPRVSYVLLLNNDTVVPPGALDGWWSTWSATRMWAWLAPNCSCPTARSIWPAGAAFPAPKSRSIAWRGWRGSFRATRASPATT